MRDEQFKLAEPFDIDDGELRGVSVEVAFALGVEWAMFRARLLDTRERFTETAHVANAERVQRMCARHGRKATVRVLNGGWAEIEVEPEVLN